MNYLAHLALADNSDASRIGNVLGDFAKGDRDYLLQSYPSELVDGLMMHREIDRFTDNHPLFKEAKKFIHPERRRFAGIVLDIYFDHFLYLHWNRFYDSNQREFIDDFYQSLELHSQWWVGNFKQAYPYMRRHDWLGTNQTREGIKLTLERVSQRGKYTAPIADCYSDFENSYDELNNTFIQLYPELIAFSKRANNSL